MVGMGGGIDNVHGSVSGLLCVGAVAVQTEGIKPVHPEFLV